MSNEEKTIRISRDDYKHAVANAVVKLNDEAEKKLDSMVKLMMSLIGVRFAAKLEEILFDEEPEKSE